MIGIGQSVPLAKRILLQTVVVGLVHEAGQRREAAVAEHSRSQTWRGVRSQEGQSRDWDLISAARSASTTRSTSTPPWGWTRWLGFLRSIQRCNDADCLLSLFCFEGKQLPHGAGRPRPVEAAQTCTLGENALSVYCLPNPMKKEAASTALFLHAGSRVGRPAVPRACRSITGGNQGDNALVLLQTY